MAVNRMKDLDLGKVKTSMDNHRGSEKLEVIIYFSILFLLIKTTTAVMGQISLFICVCVIFTCELSVGRCWSCHSGCHKGRMESAVCSTLTLHLAGQQAEKGEWLINCHTWK